MGTVSNALISSFYASAMGCLVLAIGFAGSAILEAKGLIEMVSSIGGALLIYSVSLVVSTVLATFIGSPVYCLFRKIGVAGYLSASALGVGIVYTIFGFNVRLSETYWLLAGGLTGAVYHHVFTRQQHI